MLTLRENFDSEVVTNDAFKKAMEKVKPKHEEESSVSYN